MEKRLEILPATKRVAFFAKDEGSAKALAPVIREMKARAEADLEVVAGKNAARAFRRAGISCRDAETLAPSAAFTSRPDLVVTGASMRASIEKEAIGLARKTGIRSATILDSPTWLWWRFTVDGRPEPAALPDHILVPDPACKEKMISEQFPAERLVPTGNPHYDTLLARAASPGHAVPRTVLVVTQPRYAQGKYRSDPAWLKTVLTVCRRLDRGMALTIRPHGKEDPHGFDSLLAPGITLDASSDILDLIESHRVIIGKNSSALFEAALMGKRVISFARGRSELLAIPIPGRELSRRAGNIADLRKWLGEGIDQPVPSPVPRDIPFYTDGRNGERAIDFLLKLLDEGGE
jgi:hypothetical protein